MRSIRLRHIELKEELREHNYTGTYYRVAKFGPFKHRVISDADTAKIGDNVKVDTYEIIEVPSVGLGEKTYFGLNIDQYGILHALIGHTQKTIDEKVEKALTNERRFSAWCTNQELGKQRDAIKRLPWYKRLFNKF